MRRFIQPALFVLLISLVASCAFDEAEQPIEVVIEPDFCDTITYSQHIEPIFSTNCAITGCHIPDNPRRIDLTGYQGIADNSDLILTAIKQEGTFKMPLDPNTWQSFKLPDTTIAMFECWIEKGTPND